MLERLIKNPITTSVFVLFFVILGIVSMTEMVIQHKPDVDFPMASIQVVYPGASSLDIENQIVKKIENAVSEASDIEDIISYANENYGTQIAMNAENFIYQGTFDDVAAGQVLAAAMYDKGLNAIFAAAGGVGIGAINEAKARASTGQEVWIIGVDVDQYPEGIYDGTNSIILTSAMKYIDVAAYDMIEAELNGEFPGGEILTLDASNYGIGVPPVNPNLDDEVEEIVGEAFAAMQAGTLVVSDVQGDLFK